MRWKIHQIFQWTAACRQQRQRHWNCYLLLACFTRLLLQALVTANRQIPTQYGKPFTALILPLLLVLSQV